LDYGPDHILKGGYRMIIPDFTPEELICCTSVVDGVQACKTDLTRRKEYY
jgi:hypothetical protein